MYGNTHILNSQRFFSIPSLATPAVAPAARLHRRLSFLWGLGPGLPWGPRICNMWSIDGETWCYVADTDCEMLRVQNQQKMGGWPTKTLTNHLWDSWSGPHFLSRAHMTNFPGWCHYNDFQILKNNTAAHARRGKSQSKRWSAVWLWLSIIQK